MKNIFFHLWKTDIIRNKNTTKPNNIISKITVMCVYNHCALFNDDMIDDRKVKLFYGI